MSAVTEWLKGKKAYVSAALLFLLALLEFVTTGDFSLTALLGFAKSSAVAAAIAALRAGMKKTTPPSG